jgi:hypothetical protein
MNEQIEHGGGFPPQLCDPTLTTKEPTKVDPTPDASKTNEDPAVKE